MYRELITQHRIGYQTIHTYKNTAFNADHCQLQAKDKNSHSEASQIYCIEHDTHRKLNATHKHNNVLFGNFFFTLVYKPSKKYIKSIMVLHKLPQ